MQLWHYLVILLLAVIAYRLYKIQDIVSGRAKQREEEGRKEEETDQSKPKEATNTLTFALLLFILLLLSIWLCLRDGPQIKN